MTDATYLNSRRNPAGLAATIALHAGIALIGVFAVTTSIVRVTPAPIVTRAIPDPIIDRPVVVPPRTNDLVAKPLIDQPAWTENVPLPPIVRSDSPQGEPVVLGPPTLAGIDKPIQPQALPPGPTVTARFDKRFGDVQPPYPSAARRLGEEGSVVVHVEIGRDGRVLAATLAQSSGSPRLDAAAVAYALAHWRFTPALQAGAAVDAARDITVKFRLSAAAG